MRRESVSDAVSAISTPRQNPVTKLGSVASLRASRHEFYEQLTNAWLPWAEFLRGCHLPIDLSSLD